MATDLREIQLTDEQKRRVAQLAERTGQSATEILDQQLGLGTAASKRKSERVYKDRYIEDYEEWYKYFQQWSARRKSYNPNFDDSRESIYPDRV